MKTTIDILPVLWPKREEEEEKKRVKEYIKDLHDMWHTGVDKAAVYACILCALI